MTLDFTEANAVRLAEAFAKVLRYWLTKEQMAEVIKRNRAQPNKHICHSHDFCDANMAMLEAADNLWPGVFATFSSENEDAANFWSRAWAIAGESEFSTRLKETM